jgi:glycosyltransferase involved in cell wall biosynthesis
VQIFRAIFHLWRVALSHKPDVLHAYLPLTNFLGALAARLAGVNIVITSRRALGKHQDRHQLWMLFDRMANRLSTFVTVNSKAVGLDTIARDGIAPDKLVLINNGLDFAAYDELAKGAERIRQSLGLDEDTIGILSAGNLIPYKGYGDLFQAIARLKPGTRPLRFFIAGRDDGIGGELKRKLRDLHIADRVVFLGQYDNVPRLMAAMDMFVMPSHEEGFSNALLEAMAAGLPIITTRVGGNPEALEDGLYGDLVPPHDPAVLAEAIEKVINSLDRARITGRKGAQHVRSRYGAEVMVQSYIALYDSERPPWPQRVKADVDYRKDRGV